MISRVRYNMIGASLAGVERHPQEHMIEIARDLGVKILTAEPVPIADCWLFSLEGDSPLILPDYITRLPSPKGHRER